MIKIISYKQIPRPGLFRAGNLRTGIKRVIDENGNSVIIAKLEQ